MKARIALSNAMICIKNANVLSLKKQTNKQTNTHRFSQTCEGQIALNVNS